MSGKWFLNEAWATSSKSRWTTAGLKCTLSDILQSKAATLLHWDCFVMQNEIRQWKVVFHLFNVQRVHLRTMSRSWVKRAVSKHTRGATEVGDFCLEENISSSSFIDTTKSSGEWTNINCVWDNTHHWSEWVFLILKSQWDASFPQLSLSCHVLSWQPSSSAAAARFFSFLACFVLLVRGWNT